MGMKLSKMVEEWFKSRKFGNRLRFLPETAKNYAAIFDDRGLIVLVKEDHFFVWDDHKSFYASDPEFFKLLQERLGIDD